MLTIAVLSDRNLKIHLPNNLKFTQIFFMLHRELQNKKIPKRNPYYFECSQSLWLVFRNPAVQDELRTMPTPAVDQLKLQLLQFKNKWEGITYNGKHVLPPAALAEIQSLLVHIQTGCLSGILPSSCSTIRLSLASSICWMNCDLSTSSGAEKLKCSNDVALQDYLYSGCHLIKGQSLTLILFYHPVGNPPQHLHLSLQWGVR